MSSFPGRFLSAHVLVSGLALAVCMVAAQPASPTTVVRRNLAELIVLSEDVVVGRVVAVHGDGGDATSGGLPWTEITIEVEEALRGSGGAELLFRQFGLPAPLSGDGARGRHLQSPPGWPRFEVGEKVLLFLHGGSASTGLRTTVGLEQGKFLLVGDHIANPLGNRGLLSGVEIRGGADAGRLDALRAASAEGRPLRASELLDFVRMAISERWFE